MWDFVHALFGLLQRSWQALLHGLGTTFLGVVVAFISFLLPLILTTLIKVRRQGWGGLVSYYRTNRTRLLELAIPTVLGAIMVWTSLFGAFVVWTIYTDHVRDRQLVTRRTDVSITVALYQPNSEEVQQGSSATLSANDDPPRNRSKPSLVLAQREVSDACWPSDVATYSFRKESRLTHILYNLPYLDSLRSGFVRGLNYKDCPFGAKPPELLVNVVNNTNRSLAFDAVVLTIASSKVDYEPVIVIDCLNPLYLTFNNQGWGDVFDPELEFTFDDPSDHAGVSLFAPKSYRVNLLTFTDIAKVKITDYLPARLRLAGDVGISGALSYGPPQRRQTLKFQTRVTLQIQPRAPLPPDLVYNIRFKAGQPGVVTTPLQPAEVMMPNAAAAFLLRIRTDKTSQTRMSIGFRTNDGETVPGGEFLLDIFAPRCGTTGFVQQTIKRAP